MAKQKNPSCSMTSSDSLCRGFADSQPLRQNIIGLICVRDVILLRSTSKGFSTRWWFVFYFVSTPISEKNPI